MSVYQDSTEALTIYLKDSSIHFQYESHSQSQEEVELEFVDFDKISIKTLENNDSQQISNYSDTEKNSDDDSLLNISIDSVLLIIKDEECIFPFIKFPSSPTNAK